jgi:MFS family permease
VTESQAESTAELSSIARIGRVLRNPRVRKVQLAFVGSTIGDWAFSTAIFVWAFLDGGATAVGAYQAARFISMAVGGPIGGVIADRMSRKRFMMVADASRAALVTVAALTISADGPSILVYVLAVVSGLIGSPFRAAQAGLLPDLVESPEDLTASNAVAGNLEGISMFAGPALAGVIIAATDVQAVFWLNVASFVLSFLLLSTVRVTRDDGGSVDAVSDDDGANSVREDLIAGFRQVARDRDLRGVALLSGAAGFAWGNLMVMMVLLATQVLDTGPEGLGYLNSVFGVAGVVGGVVVLGRISSSRLGEDMVLSVFGWGLPLLVLALFPAPATAIGAMVVIGLSDPVGTLGFETIPQRIAPPAMLSRVYAAIESGLIAPMALGCLVAPHLEKVLGLRGTLAIAGGVAVLAALLLWPQMRRLDRRLTAPPELELLRGVSVFDDLPAPALERLAHACSRLRLGAGATVLAEGSLSDRFYVVVTGQVEVTQGGRVLRTEGPDEFFGEIGLLRDVLRTATVATTEDSEFLVIERSDFLAAAGSLGEGGTALDDVVVRRLFG